VTSPARDLISALDGGPLLLDGAIGSELLARSGPDVVGELLNVERPELVRALHDEHLAAGCDALTTNSFCADAPTLSRRGLGGRSVELGLAAARIARAAADRAAADGRARWVLGSLGPGHALPTLHGGDPAALERGYRELAGALLAGGVDALLVETVRDLRQARAALAGARTAAHDAALLVAFAPCDDGTLAGGVALASAVEELSEFEPVLWGVNCVAHASALERALASLRAAGARRLGAWPNAGLPDTTGPVPRWPIEPEPFARDLAATARRFALSLVGGCCGTTPAHLAALGTRLARG
jgi:5-methyltetrahydrofolate--homocysteine methyltransferase